LPAPQDEAYACLRFIDWYGDTIFNTMQVQHILIELNSLEQQSLSDEERKLLADLRIMAQVCLSEPHLFLRFYGD
jgi:hypothetical protein